MNNINETGKKVNNAGFTLVEIIIAVIILAIVSIPLLRSFSSAANTSGKAAIKTRATNAAENLMEDLKSMDKDGILKKYNGAVIPPNSEGVIPGSGAVAYEFQVASGSTEYDDDLNTIINNSDYSVTIRLDPSTYPNANKLNLSDFNTVNSDTSAVYCLSDAVDNKVYAEFVDLNAQMDSDFIRNEAYFKENLKREIRVDISDSGKTVTDKDGNVSPAVDVRVVVTYLLVDSEKIVPTGREMMQKVSRQVFSGNISGNALQSIYIMYPPRYEAAKKDGDIITIHNRDSIEANLYIIAQNVGSHASEWKDYRKKLSGGLNLQIYEGEIEDKENGGTKQPLTLYTNVHDKVDYLKKDDSAVVPVQCYLNLDAVNKDPEKADGVFDSTTFNKLKSKKGKFEDIDATKALNAKDVDGKTLDAASIEDRLYDVTVTIKKNVGDDEWPVKVELTGSLLE